MGSTRQGQNYQEDAAVAAAIAAVEAANEANADAINNAIVDFAASIDIDDKGVAVNVDEANECVEARGDDAVSRGDYAVGHRAGGNISDGNDRGDGNGDGHGGRVEWKRVTKKRKSEMCGNEMYIHFDLQFKEMGRCPYSRCNCVHILADDNILQATVMRYLCRFKVKTNYRQDSIVFELLR